MYAEKTGQLSTHLRSFGQYLGGTFRAQASSHRSCKLILFICLWLAMMIALLHHTFDYTVVVPWKAKPALPQSDSLIPRRIWQIFLSPPSTDKDGFSPDPKKLTESASWLALNRDYEYHLVGDRGAEAFIDEYYSKNETLKELFKVLRNPGMKSDLLRYLILSIKGGIYADTDTVAIKPIDEWVPPMYRNRTQTIVGIEFDRLDGPNWNEVHPDLQFCQWTIATAPGRPLLHRMAQKVVDSLSSYAQEHNSSFADMKISASDVMKLTGPSSWTDSVFEELQRQDQGMTSLRILSDLKEPRLVGDILVLPINGFGMGQPHSNSANDGSVPDDALLKHIFKGSWRNQKRSKLQAKSRTRIRGGEVGGS